MSAFVTGTATSQADLVAAIKSACTTNGWSLSGDVLHRDGQYVRLQSVAAGVTVQGGTGIDGGNNLTGAGSNYVRMTDIGTAGDGLIVYPLVYEVHIHDDPNEVYVVINYSQDFYQWLAWGKSTVSLPGTGNWYAGSFGQAAVYQSAITISATGGGVVSGTGHSSGALWWTSLGPAYGACNHFIHHGMDGVGWDNTGVTINAVEGLAPLITISPNAWNGESELLQIMPLLRRASSKVSILAQLGWSRYVRIDNYEPGQVIVIGPDKWKIFPWLRKNSAARAGGAAIRHSGTFGWAIRYHGA